MAENTAANVVHGAAAFRAGKLTGRRVRRAGVRLRRFTLADLRRGLHGLFGEVSPAREKLVTMFNVKLEHFSYCVRRAQDLAAMSVPHRRRTGDALQLPHNLARLDV